MSVVELRTLSVEDPVAAIAKCDELLATPYAKSDRAYARDVLARLARAGRLVGDLQVQESAAARLQEIGARGDLVARAYAGFIRAGIHADAGRELEAITLATAVAEELDASGDRLNQAIASIELCDVAISTARPDVGEPHCEDARRRWTAIGDHFQIARAYNYLSNTSSNRGQLSEAVKLALVAQDEFRKAGMPSIVAMMDDNIAGYYLELGEPARALPLSRRALEWEERSGKASHAVSSRANVATALTMLGRHQEALALLDRSIDDAKRLGLDAQLLDLYDTQIKAAEKAGRPAIAIAAAKEARDLVQANADKLRQEAIAEAEARYRSLQRQRELDAAESKLSRQRLGIALAIVAIVSLSAIAILLFLLLRSVRRREREFEQLSRTDPLTEASNRRALVQAMQAALDRIGREGGSAALFVIDADHFKQVNDTWGHQAGDAVLRDLVSRVREHVRASDTLGRLGGEEFGLVLPGIAADEAMARAEVVRQSVVATPVAFESASVPLSVSIGVAVAEKGRFAAVDDWMGAADRAVYEAKRLGRNRVARAE